MIKKKNEEIKLYKSKYEDLKKKHVELSHVSQHNLNTLQDRDSLIREREEMIKKLLKQKKRSKANEEL